MPEWTKNDERKYERIKESGLDRGMKEGRAKEIAARTVNKDRREEGRTPNQTTQGTGNPNKAIEERSKKELYNLAEEKKIDGRSRLNKTELAQAIKKKK